MRLRTVMLLASGCGALCALLLAADLYRRIKAAETMAIVGAGGVHTEVLALYGTAHVLSALALGFIFLGIFMIVLTAASEAEFRPVQEPVPVSAETAPPAAAESQNVEAPPAETPQTFPVDPEAPPQAISEPPKPAGASEELRYP